jgi:MFS family permease
MVVAVLCAADFLGVLDGLVVAVALPSMQRDLGIGPAELQWVVNAYVLCFGGFMLLGGRLGDLVGQRRVLGLGLGLFAAGALAGGLAPTPAVLVAGRAGQGLGAALMTPAALALLAGSFPAGPARDRAVGWWSAAGSVGIPAGALLGGLLTAALGWRWVLLVNVPAAVVAALAALLVLEPGRGRGAGAGLDLPGAVLVTSGLALVILAIVRTGQGPGAGPAGAWAPMAAGLALLAAFGVVEARARHPLVPPELRRAPGLVPASLVGAALPVGLGALLFLATLYLQRVLGFGPLQTGLAYLTLALPVVAASPAASWLVARGGRRAVAVAGLLLQAAGLALLARVQAGGGFATGVLPGFVAVGLGAPLAFVPATAAAMELRAPAGLASGLFTTAQQLGNALALAAIATTAAARTQAMLAGGAGPGPALAAGHRAGFLLAAIIALAAVPPALALAEG